MDFKHVPNQYRPIPFWSWNEKLNTEETARQVKLLHEAGIGGFFMHARGGLQTEFMGEEWFGNISRAAEEAKKLDMGAWAYDENGWPSGFGGGRVNGKGEKFQQKYLRMEEGEKETPRTIGNYGGYHFYYDVNPFYVDTLDAEVIADFIHEIYEPYYERFKNEIAGFFTDEPQISRDGIPWSLQLPAAYKEAYGEELLPHLAELFQPVGAYKDTRVKFWKLITDLFSKNYMKQIYDWCTARGLGFTGHLVLEEDFESQLTSNGAVMPHYEYFTMPGMDWLGRPIKDCLTPIQVSSVAQQLGKKQVLSETFALCGHNISFEELRRIYEWQMVHGINMLCQHLLGYSLRGIRKRDYPPAMYYQQPWWGEFNRFADAMSRVGMILAEGRPVCDTLLLHPQTTAWTLFDNGENKGLSEYYQQFLAIVKNLERKHILFHLGDETIMERHAHVEGAALVIGTQRYTTVILPPEAMLLDSTKRLLEDYRANGGKIAAAEELRAETIIDNENITYTMRQYDGFDIHYFVNSTAEEQAAHIAKGAKYVDIATGEVHPFGGDHVFAPYDSLLVMDDGTARTQAPVKKALRALPLEGEWRVREQGLNVLTLDRCDYYFDGKLEEQNGYVLNIQGRACALRRPVRLRQEYHVEADAVPEELYLVLETPGQFVVSINGVVVEQKDAGYFVDSAFRKIPVQRYFKRGRNSIVLETMFHQSETVYENLEKSVIFESEKNKLTYDIEIEPVYLAGRFSVLTDAAMEPLDKGALRYRGGFRLGAPAGQVNLQHLEQQGFPFFAGTLTVEKTMQIEDTAKKLVFRKKGVNAIKVCVNGADAGTVLWNPTELDLSGYLHPGENTVTLTLINNLRNMMGPHHLKEGESYFVCPSTFFKEPCVWAAAPEAWDDGYCFVEFSLI